MPAVGKPDPPNGPRVNAQASRDELDARGKAAGHKKPGGKPHRRDSRHPLAPEWWIRPHTEAARMHTERQVQGRRGMRGGPEEQLLEETRSSHAPRKCCGC